MAHLQFTDEEIAALKEMAQEKLRFDRILNFDKEGNPIPYQNRYSITPPHLPPEKEDKKC